MYQRCFFLNVNCLLPCEVAQRNVRLVL
uniref:Uncharacterized protein n=1 Tax=Arundo donax TaxID=35708 RepID=A0A0A9BER7_ARUDO